MAKNIKSSYHPESHRLTFAQFLETRGTPNLNVQDQSILSPSGTVSKAARNRMLAREGERLAQLGEAQNDFNRLVDSGEVVDPTGRTIRRASRPSSENVEADRLRQQATELRGLADRGMRPRIHRKQAAELEQQAALLIHSADQLAPERRRQNDGS